MKDANEVGHSGNENRHRWQFSLRLVLIVVALSAALVAGVTYRGLNGFLVVLALEAASVWLYGVWKGHYTNYRLAGVVGLVMVAVLYLQFFPATATSPEAGARNQCQKNLLDIGVALAEYKTKNGRLPPAYTRNTSDVALHSWRTLILPHLVKLKRRIQLDESWDSVTNAEATQINLPIFQCPTDGDAKRYDTSYVAIVGLNTVWDDRQNADVNAKRDSLSDTIVVIEFKNSGIKWAEPRDLDLNNLPPGITRKNLMALLSNHRLGFNALFADGHVEFIPSSIPWSDFEAMLTIDGGETIDRSKWEF